MRRDGGIIKSNVRPWREWGVLAPALAVLLTASGADALPRYTAQYGQSCVLCHANPTGGGMRSLYASQYIVPEELAARSGGVGNDGAFSPELNDHVTVGADLRTLVWQREEGVGSVFSMQGDVYLEARLDDEIAAYAEYGQSGGGEVFAHLRMLPGDGYVKAGRFFPDYGWRFADHQMFNRRFLLSEDGVDDPKVLLGQGVEAGVSPGPLTVTASVLDGQPELGENYAARALLQRGAGAVNVGAGASVLRRSTFDGHSRAVGAFWYVSAGPVTWLGEYDETRLQGRLGNLAAHEVTVRLRRGLDARVTYGFQDPNRAEYTGARQRYGAGLAYLPRPYLGLQAMVHRWDNDPGADVSDPDRYEGELMLHVFF
jgi:hypothetical protein